MSSRAASWIACSVWGLCGALARSAACFLHPARNYKGQLLLGCRHRSFITYYPTVGALVTSRRPENLIGWILCKVGLLFVIEGFVLVYSGFALSVGPGSLPGEMIVCWVSGGFDFPMVVLGLTLMVLLIPNGRLPAPG